MDYEYALYIENIQNKKKLFNNISLLQLPDASSFD